MVNVKICLLTLLLLFMIYFMFELTRAGMQAKAAWAMKGCRKLTSSSLKFIIALFLWLMRE